MHHFFPWEANMNALSTKKLKSGKHHICPWWMAYLFDNPLRRLIHPPNKILGPYVKKGMTVLDLGCGFGHFALGMARLTGPTGRVAAVDVQQKMLDKTMSRARKAGLAEIVQPVLCDGHRIGQPFKLDFALASNSLHEVPDPAGLLAELFTLLFPGAMFLLLEPCAHLKQERFEAELAMARTAGFVELERPRITRQMGALLQKPADAMAP
jgi:ubiquinone/menaquinone biosynthesis C-methylase UbiE